MTRLHRLQSELQAYLLGAPNGAAQHVADTGRLSAVARLQIYADAYRLRLCEALESDFPALRAWLGAERFTEAAERYLATHASTHYSLRYFGQHLPRFLAETAPYTRTPLLAELALFEWALGTAFDAPGQPVLAPEALAAVAPADWPSLRFEPHASVARLDLAWNAPAIRKAVDSATQPMPAAIRAEGKVSWLVWRQDYHTYFRSLAADEAQAFDALRRGDTFSDVCTGLSGDMDEAQVAARAAELLRQWLADGVIGGFGGEDQSASAES